MHNRLFGRAVRGLVITAVVSACGSAATAQTPPDPGPSFALESVVEIDASIMVAGIDGLDVRGDTLVVTDTNGHGVYLLRKDGRLIRSLSLEECRPGHELLPLAARITREHVILTSSGVPMMRFTRDGECLAPVRRDLLPVARWDAADDGRLALLGESNVSVILRDADGAETATATIRAPTHPQLERRWLGGGIRVVGSTTWAIGVLPDVLAAVDSSGRARTIPIRSSVTRLPDGPDLPSAPGPAMFSALDRLALDGTFAGNLFALTDDVFLVPYSRRSEFGYLLLGHDGQEIEARPFGARIVHASDARLYVVDQPEADPAGEIPNPRILVYRYRQ